MKDDDWIVDNFTEDIEEIKKAKKEEDDGEEHRD